MLRRYELDQTNSVYYSLVGVYDGSDKSLVSLTAENSLSSWITVKCSEKILCHDISYLDRKWFCKIETYYDILSAVWSLNLRILHILMTCFAGDPQHKNGTWGMGTCDMPEKCESGIWGHPKWSEGLHCCWHQLQLWGGHYQPGQGEN